MLNQGITEAEVYDRLQARVPEFSLSPDPGGKWNWLIGLIAFGVASSTLVLLIRSVARKGAPVVAAEDVAKADFDEEQHWQDRLDDELLDSEL